MLSPLILTLGLDAPDQARFERLRQAHFPAAMNHIPAHLTLFHHLPGELLPDIDAALAQLAVQPPFPIEVTGLRSLGRGVAFTLASPVLTRLRATLAQHFHDSLTPQDRQAFRPHVTIQNKATPEAARALLAAMQAEFSHFTVRADSLLLWHYRGGPWEHAANYPFASPPPVQGGDEGG